MENEVEVEENMEKLLVRLITWMILAEKFWLKEEFEAYKRLYEASLNK